MIIKLLLNYLILVLCAVLGFRVAGVIPFFYLILPVLQIGLSRVNYRYNHKWQTVLLLELNLLVSTAAGIFLIGQSFYKHVSDDYDSHIIMLLRIMVNAALALILCAVTTLRKYIKNRKDAQGDGV